MELTTQLRGRQKPKKTSLLDVDVVQSNKINSGPTTPPKDGYKVGQSYDLMQEPSGTRIGTKNRKNS